MEAVAVGGKVERVPMSEKYAVAIEIAKTLGAPTLVCGVVMWFCWDTITWERSLMLPALQETAKALQATTEALDSTTDVLERVEDKLEKAP